MLGGGQMGKGAVCGKFRRGRFEQGGRGTRPSWGEVDPLLSVQ